MENLSIPLLSSNAANNDEPEVIHGESDKTLDDFLYSLGVNSSDICHLAVEQHQNSRVLIQRLKTLIASETACTSGFKWASLDHMIEKMLQSVLLSNADLNNQSRLCSARVRPAERSLLLKSQSGLRTAYSIRGFVKGVEFTLEKSVHYFVYAILLYRLATWAQTGNFQFEEFEKLWSQNSQKGIDTLINLLSKIDAQWLMLILNLPLFVGSAFSLAGCLGSGEISADALKSISERVIAHLPWTHQEHPVQLSINAEDAVYHRASSGFLSRLFYNTIRETVPILSLSGLGQKIQKLERAIRWDGRVSAEDRLSMFHLVYRLALEGRQMNQLHAMESLARIAHGIGLKDLARLEKAGYSKEDVLAIIYTKVFSLHGLMALSKSPNHQTTQRMIQYTRKLYASYLLWWLGLSTSTLRQKVPFMTYKMAKLAAEIYFLNKLINSILTAINCPDKPGFQFAEGYADWSSNYSLDCFHTALYHFRRINPNENATAFLSTLENYYIDALTELDISDKNLNGTEFYLFMQIIGRKAGQLQVLKANRNAITVLEPNTFQGLSQLTFLELITNREIKLMAQSLRGLSQLRSLYLDDSVSDIAIGAFQDLGQLRELYLNYVPLSSLSKGMFHGLSRVTILSLDSNFQGSITNISVGAFQGLDQLQNLTLRGTSVSTLRKGVFQDLSQLQSLNLGQSWFLTDVDPDVFENLTRLTALYFDDNNVLTNIPSGLFRNLIQLRILDLSLMNFFVNLPQEIFQNLDQLRELSMVGPVFNRFFSNTTQTFPQLTSLSLLSAPLEQLPLGTFQKFNQLLQLSLTDCSGFSRNISQDLPQLTSLIVGGLFSGDPFGDISLETFQGLSQLRCLIIEGIITHIVPGAFHSLNQLTELRSYVSANLSANTFEGLSQLRYLELSFLQSTNIVIDTFQGLSQLIEFKLSGDVGSLPSGIFRDLKQLLYLELYLGDFSDVTAGVFQNLNQLLNLSLYGNYLTNLAVDVFKDISHLKHLKLGSDQLTNFDGLALLTQLKTFSFENNGLTHIPLNIFSRFEQLQTLILAGNALKNLTVGAFEGLKQLITLDLGFTQLKHIPVGTFQGLDNLQTLDLGGNSLNNLTAGAFQGLSHLTRLRLGFAHKETIRLIGKTFQGLDQLQRLDLSGLTPEFETMHIEFSEKTFNGLSQLTSLNFAGSGLYNISLNLQGLPKLLNLNLNYTYLDDASLLYLMQHFPYQIKNLGLQNSWVSENVVTELINLLPCTQIESFDFSSGNLINASSISTNIQQKLMEKVCADRLCHANLPSSSCAINANDGAMSVIGNVMPTLSSWAPGFFGQAHPRDQALPMRSSGGEVLEAPLDAAKASAGALSLLLFFVLVYMYYKPRQSLAVEPAAPKRDNSLFSKFASFFGFEGKPEFKKDCEYSVGLSGPG